MYDFYEYPKCSTCRKAKATLENLGIDYNAIDIKLNPPTAEQFEKWFAEVPVKKFFNTSGLVYKELNLKEIGAVLEVGESRVSQLHSQAIKRLRIKLGKS